MTIENRKDLITRQREMKARMKAAKKADPEKWAKLELEDKQALETRFPNRRKWPEAKNDK